jgi:siroheme synthase-like protein
MELVYPLFLDLAQLPVIIIGGGAVAMRKAAGVLAAGGTNVRAVAPKFVKDFPDAVKQVVAPFDPNHLQGARLVFAATDSPAVNEAVVVAARQRGVLVNRADVEDEARGDFIVPALLRCGPITVAVSAAGSPAVSAAVRDHLAGAISNDWVNLAEAMRQIRPRVKSAGLTTERRHQILKTLATDDAIRALAGGGLESLWAWAREKFPELPPAAMDKTA